METKKCPFCLGRGIIYCDEVFSSEPCRYCNGGFIEVDDMIIGVDVSLGKDKTVNKE